MSVYSLSVQDLLVFFVICTCVGRCLGLEKREDAELWSSFILIHIYTMQYRVPIPCTKGTVMVVIVW